VTGGAVVVGGFVVGTVVGACVVGGSVVGGRVGVVVPGLPPVGLTVVVVARRTVVVVAGRPPETPRRALVPAGALAAVVVVGRLGPVVVGALELAGATVGAGENAVPRASHPGPQRPWAARAKATVKATRAKTENPATRTRRLARQPSVSATAARETRSTRPAWALPAAAANGAQDGARLAAALTSAGVPLVSAGPPSAAGSGRAVLSSTGGCRSAFASGRG